MMCGKLLWLFANVRVRAEPLRNTLSAVPFYVELATWSRTIVVVLATAHGLVHADCADTRASISATN